MGRRRNENTLSLFAFQDIITGVAGVMLFILLLLVVQLAIPAARKIQEKAKDAPSFPIASATDIRKIEELKRQLSLMRSRTDDLLQVQSMRPDATIASLKNDLQAIIDRQSQSQQQADQLQKRTLQMRSDEETSSMVVAAESMQAEIDQIDEDLKRFKQGDFISFRAADSMPNVWMIDLRRESAEFVFLTDPTRSKRVKFSPAIETEALVASLDKELKRNQSDLSVVVLLRPSSAGRGSELLVRLQALGYRIALELLDSETQIRQSAPSPEQP